MNRVVKKISIGDGNARWRLLVEDDPSPFEGETTATRFLKFIQALADQPSLLRCGPGYPKEMKISHTGTCWTLTAEVVAKDAQSS